MAPGHIMPSGSAVPVDGGYRVSGQWGYATGILHADWVLFSAPVTGHGKNATPDLRRFYVPVEDCEIVDGWDVSTMAATGSYDMALDDTFIPEYRQVKIADVIAQTSPGLAINQGPLWRMPFISFTSLIAVAPMIGGAEAMFALTSDILKTKVGAQSGIVQQAAMAQQIRMARIQMTIKSMLALWENALDFVWEKTVSGAPLTMEERAEARVIAAHAAKICDQAANELAVAAGSRGIFNDAPLQRFRREINALATHAFFDYDHLASLYGGTLLGADLPPHAMI
jgi:3-hydroxy-9,10-secoandrosta-1,3,5(10)-triene-9,17-dione monooxygenase